MNRRRAIQHDIAAHWLVYPDQFDGTAALDFEGNELPAQVARAMLRSVEDGRPVTTIDTTRRIADTTGEMYEHAAAKVAALVSEKLTPPSGIPTLIRELAKIGAQERAAAAYQKAANALREGQSVGEVQSKLSNELREGSLTLSHSGALDAIQVLERWDELERRRDMGEVVTIKTGYESIDNAVGSLQPGLVWTVIAKSSVGKSLFVSNVLAGALSVGVPCAFASLEMTAALACKRMRSHLGGDIPFVKFAAPSNFCLISPREVRMTNTLDTIRSTCEMWETEHRKKLGVLAIDYLQYLRASTRAASRYQEVSDLTADIKELAKEMGVLVLLLSQIRRRQDRSDSKILTTQPTLEDGRDSGTIEENCDLMSALWRSPDDPTDVLMFRNLKLREGGSTAPVALHFQWQNGGRIVEPLAF